MKKHLHNSELKNSKSSDEKKSGQNLRETQKEPIKNPDQKEECNKDLILHEKPHEVNDCTLLQARVDQLSSLLRGHPS